MKSFYRFILALPLIVLLTGCDIDITNLTSEAVPDNPSGVFTITVDVRSRSANIVENSIDPHIVIDGQTYPMNASSLGPNRWEFDYEMPPGRKDVTYYFVVDYKMETRRGGQRPRQAFSDLQPLRVISRFPVSLETNRAPIGARVGVMGRGFKSSDQIFVGGQPAQTVYHSPNSLSFFVPPLNPGLVYPVQLADGDRVMNAGNLRVDGGTLRVVPSSLAMAKGESRNLVFTLNQEAPPEGLLIPVYTDLPDALEMPEVRIPGGSRSVNVRVRAVEEGEGSLFVEMPGFQPITIPINVD